MIKGEWKQQLVTDGMSAAELLESIKNQYDLDEYISDCLVIGYDPYTTAGKKKWKELQPTALVDELGMRTSKEGDQVAITVDNLELFAQQNQGDEVDEDVSCDSKFMLEKIPGIGTALRAAYNWVPVNEKVYLFMDNAGGNRTDVAISQYNAILKNDYNVEIVWQVPQLPETNMLDLGVWMSIQAAVMLVHHVRRCHHDALAKSVEDAWNDYLSPDAFKRVHDRLRVVLTCIVDDKGGNSLVESKCGKLFRDATIIDLTGEDDEDDGNSVQAFTFDDLDELDDDVIDD